MNKLRPVFAIVSARHVPARSVVRLKREILPVILSLQLSMPSGDGVLIPLRSESSLLTIHRGSSIKLIQFVSKKFNRIIIFRIGTSLCHTSNF